MINSNKTTSWLMVIGGALMVVSSCGIMALTLIDVKEWTLLAVQCLSFAFLVGSLAYTIMQRISQKYNGSSITVRRLLSIQLLSGICLILAGLLMVENFCHFVLPYVSHDIQSQMTYLKVVHNNWAVLLLIGAALQMYTAHRLSSEMNKES